MARLALIDAIKGIACLSIAFLHFFVLGFRPQQMLSFYLFVDIFAILSGYVLCLKYAKFVKAKGGFEPFIKKRFKRIYKTYLPAIALVFILIFMPAIAGFDTRQKAALYINALIKDIFLIPSFQGSNLILRQAWTLTAELWCYVVFYPLVALCLNLFSFLGKKALFGFNHKSLKSSLCFYGILHIATICCFVLWFFWYQNHSASGIVGLDRNTEFYNIQNTFTSGFYRVLLEFCIGLASYPTARLLTAYLRHLCGFDLSFIKKMANLFLSICFIYIFCFSLSFFTSGGSYKGSSLDFILPLCFSLFLLFYKDFLHSNSSFGFYRFIVKFFSFFGRQSYSFYIWHIAVYEILTAYTNILSLPSVYAVAAMFALTIPVSYLSYLLTEGGLWVILKNKKSSQ